MQLKHGIPVSLGITSISPQGDIITSITSQGNYHHHRKHFYDWPQAIYHSFTWTWKFSHIILIFYPTTVPQNIKITWEVPASTLPALPLLLVPTPDAGWMRKFPSSFWFLADGNNMKCLPNHAKFTHCWWHHGLWSQTDSPHVMIQRLKFSMFIPDSTKHQYGGIWNKHGIFQFLVIVDGYL